MTQIACTHKWEPMAILGRPAKSCALCSRWAHIRKREFVKLFGHETFREAALQANDQILRVTLNDVDRILEAFSGRR